jgi:phosphocarrier protein NPr
LGVVVEALVTGGVGVFGRWQQRKVTITHPGGLHARPALAVAQTVRRFQSRVEIGNGRETVDAGEVLQLLTLGAACGAHLTIAARGPDAEQALDALEHLFADNFGMGNEP